MLSLEKLNSLRDTEAEKGHGFNVDVLNTIIAEKEVKNASESTGSFVEGKEEKK